MQNDLWASAFGQIAEALEAWAPVQAAIDQLAEEVDCSRASLICSFATIPAPGQPYDLATITPEEMQHIQPMTDALAAAQPWLTWQPTIPVRELTDDETG